jgi:FlaG/FlaF family flagellin (archaellin)
MEKALSPLISVAVLVVISIALASTIAPWLYELVLTTTNETSTTTQRQIKCRSAAFDLDSNYGYYGIQWNFTGNNTDSLKARIVNNGNVDLWGFSFEITLESGSGDEIKHYETTTATTTTESNPLRPPMSKIIEANITEDINSSVSTLKSVKVLNSVCVDLAPPILNV